MVSHWYPDVSHLSYVICVQTFLTCIFRQNDATEMFSLFKFLHVKPYNDWERFNSEIAKPLKSGQGVNRAMKRLQVPCSRCS